MSPFSVPSIRRRRLRALLAVAGAALASTALASTASAAPATGEVVLTLKRGAQSSLLREGVKVSPRSGKGTTQTVKLPVADLDLATGTIQTGAALTLSTKETSAKLADVTLKVGPKGTAISAKLGGKRKVFFLAKGAASIDGLSARLSGPLGLTGKGTKALRKALGLEGITAGKVGSASLTASVSELKPVTPPPADEPKGPEEPAEPKEAYPYEAECPVPAVEGNPGFGEAPEAVGGIAPSPLFNAGTSQEVTAGQVDWGFKDSFRSYVLLVPPAGTLQALDGAVANPIGTMGVAGSFWSFPASEGDYEPGNQPGHADDKLVVDGTGTVLFCKSGHGFNIALKNPTVTIDGENSRITATVGANMNGTWYPYQRADIAELDLSSVEPEVTDGGNTLAWEDVPVKMTADGEKALGAIYPEGESLDPITVEASLERPLSTECTIDSSTTDAPVAVSFALAPLPTLSSPVTGTGGTINWGFRRGTRNVVVLGGGAFTMLGGATESYPGNMGGSAAAPPAGGNGKFFRFPVSSYEYEVGTSDPGDDRLIATSDASVGFCNPNAGNYGVVLSKPTLVIDGVNSRLIANSYSFQAGKGWAGGRVELVDLDTSATDAVSAGNTVSWGEVVANETPLNAGIPVSGAIQTEALSLAGLTPASTATSWDPVAAQINLTAP